jgi:lipopolysaccharide biosynthesis glycosyltransferase
MGEFEPRDTKKYINVACFFDGNLEKQAGVLFYSLARQACNERPLRVHAYHYGLIGKNTVDMASRLSCCAFDLRLNQIKNSFSSDVSEKHDCVTTSFRLLLGELLPDLDRVIYLDIDVLVTGNFAELYDIDLRSNIIAAVPDVWINQARIHRHKLSQSSLALQITADEYVRTIIGIDDKKYFNAGVLVIDLDKWRKYDIMPRCLSFYQKNFILLYTDQDALNHVYQDRVLWIGAEWNFIPKAYQSYKLEYDYINPYIVHFAGPKPWELQVGRSKGVLHASKWDGKYWDLACSTPFGEGMLAEFYFQLSIQRKNLAYEEEKIPNAFRTKAQTWLPLIPDVVLKICAEFMCTFGRGLKLKKIECIGEMIFAYRTRAKSIESACKTP